MLSEPAFSPYSTKFSTLLESSFKFSFTFMLSTANAFNLDQSKIFSYGKELTLSQTTKF